ncbi:metal-dependent hydrolase [Acetonema longum]|uniref:Beta-lactamase n=1 Tax=Acetonema longum DSM 6540 TaxID=1009370 RepID=F7NQ36_9FIRM|nr:metal-dependent hydrolase [Acetonema longum]EGO61795.1 beta-lactamase [Acetonema longum DSM 6540]
MQLRFLGHACFQLTRDHVSLIFDPFLSDNPFQIAQPDDIHCNYVLVSHGHSDHLGDTVTIAKSNGATVISTAEIAHLCSEQGCATHAMHLGGKHAFEFGYVRLTLAFHGAGVPGGHACGFIVKFHGKTFYFAGDTGLFGDMALLGRLESIDYALLPIGDNYTMGPDDAVEAVGMLKPGKSFPCIIIPGLSLLSHRMHSKKRSNSVSPSLWKS